MSIEQDVAALTEAVLELRDQLARVPELRQGIVTDVIAGPPHRLTVTLDEGDYPEVRSLDGTEVNGDSVWVLTLPGGTRISLGDLK